jgi:hypothetical protein
MFLRCHRRKKDGKEHRYYSVEESRRLQSGRVVQRRVLYLGEINDSQQAAWRKTLEVFDEQQQRTTILSLFPEDGQRLPMRSIRSRSSWEKCSCGARGRMATAGWAASCGSNWNWIGSGNRNCRAAVKT